MPIISWLACTSSPLRAANADAVEMVSVRATSEIPRAPATSSPRSDAETLGMVNGGSPWGACPRARRRGCQIEQHCGADGEHHGDEHAGDLRQPSLEHQDDARVRTARRRTAAATVSPDAESLHESGDVADQRVGVHREAEQLRELADQDRERETRHVADLGRLGEQVGNEAQLRHPGQDHRAADQEGEHRRQGDGTRRTPVGPDEREDRGGDHRAERGVRPEHQDARRARATA